MAWSTSWPGFRPASRSALAAPFASLGPKRFHPAPLPLEELPEIDAVLISHDHYDHLNKYSLQQLQAKTKHFVVPLRVGDRLAE